MTTPSFQILKYDWIKNIWAVPSVEGEALLDNGEKQFHACQHDSEAPTGGVRDIASISASLCAAERLLYSNDLNFMEFLKAISNAQAKWKTKIAKKRDFV